MPYISEMHSKSNRDRALLMVGRAFSFGQLVLPLIAYIILPNQWKIIIVKNIIGTEINKIKNINSISIYYRTQQLANFLPILFSSVNIKFHITIFLP